MRNRAKCKRCGDIIESLTEFDYVGCTCEEIGIWGGKSSLRTYARDYGNFLRVDDDGSELPVRVINKEPKQVETSVEEMEPRELTKEEKIAMIDDMLAYYDRLPSHQMFSSLNQYDMKTVFMMMKQILM